MIKIYLKNLDKIKGRKSGIYFVVLVRGRNIGIGEGTAKRCTMRITKKLKIKNSCKNSWNGIYDRSAGCNTDGITLYNSLYDF